MGGRLGEGTQHELRIHGVAGTPPEGMLDDLEPTWPPPDGCAQPTDPTALPVWRRQPARDDRPALRAYSWSSVTSGAASTALYLLLVPHLLINMAGWAALPSTAMGTARMASRGAARGEPGDGSLPRAWSVRVVTLGVRLLALALTVIMAQWALLVALDLTAYQWAVRIRELPSWSLGLGVLAAGLVMELVLVVTRLRLRPGVARSTGTSPLTDPVGYAWLTHDQHLLWGSPQTIAAQRHAHHGVALGSITVVATSMIQGWTSLPRLWGAVVSGGGWLAMLLGLAFVAQHSLSVGRPGLAGWDQLAGASRAVGRVAVLLAAVSAARVTLSSAPMASVTPEMVEGFSNADLTSAAATGQPTVLPVIRDVGLGLTIGYTIACLLVGVVAWLLRHRATERPDVPGGHPEDGSGHRVGYGAQAFGLPGMALLGGAVGGGMGAALAVTTSRFLSEGEELVVPGSLPEALAITFAVLIVLLGWVMVVGMAVAIRAAAMPSRAAADAPPGWRVVLTTAVHHLLRRGSWLTATLTVLGVLGVGMVVVLVRAPDNPLHVLQGADPLPQLIVLVAAGLVASTAGLGVALLTGRSLAGGLTVLGLIGIATVVVIGVPSDELTRQLRPAAMGIGLLTPGGIVLAKGVSALRSASDRRTVAILWDVGTFLPRWFDPLSPPTYGDRVVTDLCHLMTAQLAPPEGDEGPAASGAGLLLAPHSQGTVIAATAILGLPEETDTSALALLTYGSPLRHLYAEFFPRLFDHSTFIALDERLGGRWRNLARTSDPIGAPVGLTHVDVVLDDPCGRGHSAYPREPAYDDAVTELQRALMGHRVS